MRAMRAQLRAAALTLLAAVATSAANVHSIAAPANGYEEVKNWPSLPPNVHLGEVPGVAVDSHGHVFIFHRPGRGFEPTATEVLADPAIVEVDAESGKLIASWGAQTCLVRHAST